MDRTNHPNEEMILLASFQSFEDAEQLVDLLRENGVQAYLRNEFSNRFLSPMIDVGGYRVEISDLDARQAIGILEREGYALPDETESNVGVVANLADKLPFFRGRPLEFRLWALLGLVFLLFTILALSLYLLSPHP
ncbi:MAG: DUF2007 domain-containing protein [Porphyromonas sp.]|nr:DUF2007 domain-containing protein [Porphyromonas sp.]